MTQQELEHAVALLAPRILLIREVRRPTVATTKAMGDRARRLVEGLPSFDLIVDLNDAGRPDAEVRAAIHDQMAHLPVQRVVVVAANVFLRIATRFILNGLDIPRLDAADVPSAVQKLAAA